MKKPIVKALLMIFVLFPISVAAATMLWNGVLTQVVTWAGPISFWQMFGLMVLWYLMYPGKKPNVNKNNG